MWIYIFIATIGTIISICTGILWYIQFKQYQQTERRNKILEDKNNELNTKLNELNAQFLITQDQLTAAITNNNQTEENLQNRYNILTDNIAAAENQLNQLNQQLQDRTNGLNDIAAQYEKTHNILNSTLAQNAAAADELASYKSELNELLQNLNNAKETSRVALLKDYQNEQKSFDFSLSDKEYTLIRTIKEISNLYPELSKDLATIEWKKIWLPKVQNIAAIYELNNRGIYRLILKSDENISYVGQAINIKERWYEHIKKMLGVDSKGNEKLYNYRPEDFYWTVLEMNSGDLNQSEHYWISYYCCTEIGLNKKK